MNSAHESLPIGPGEHLAAEMAAAWERGERLPAEYYLGQDPALLESSEAAVRVIYEEVCLRQEHREPVSLEELRRRFPRWASELALMLDCHQLVQAHVGPPRFPSPGETLGEFRLISELGRGARARVYLATQQDLADRPVVLKVTPRQDQEFLTLARFQHTHIIPLHGVYDFPGRNLRALCMPFLGGTTLARLLETLRDTPLEARTGRSLVEALDRLGAGFPASLPATGTPREALARSSYAEAICWLGACLAEALQHAHSRGMVHLDLKPSNVLLAADGQPLLLDFHLAHQPFPAGAPAPEGLGGTLCYMSPEQRAAYSAGSSGIPVPQAVDARSDLYSLGRVLHAALGAGEPTGLGVPEPLHRANRTVSVGLSDIVQRCLAAEPAQRYSDASSLAGDLRRHLGDLPLRGVRNRSLRESWSKWRRRRPSALLLTGLVVALLTLPLAVAVVVGERLRDAREALSQGRDRLRERAHAEAARTLSRGRSRVEGLPGGGWLVIPFDAPTRTARRGLALENLHALTERLRLLAGGEVFTQEHLRLLDSHCRAAWEMRHLVVGRGHASLDAATEEQGRVDLLDLALLWSDLVSQTASDGNSRRLEPRTILEEAEASCGPSAPLTRERLLREGKGNSLPGVAPRTSWERVALARSLLRAGEIDQAVRELELTRERRPQDFWPHFYLGVCAYRQGRHSDAQAAFGTALALAPECAEVYHNRAMSHAASGRLDRALGDYDRALSLAPGLAASALNRGLLHFQQGRKTQALADLQRALAHGAPEASVCYHLARIYLASGDRTAAREQLGRVLRHDPRHAEALELAKQLGRVE